MKQNTAIFHWTKVDEFFLFCWTLTEICYETFLAQIVQQMGAVFAFLNYLFFWIDVPQLVLHQPQNFILRI